MDPIVCFGSELDESSDDDEDFWLLEETCGFSAAVLASVVPDAAVVLVEPVLVLIEITASLLGKHRLNPHLTTLIDSILKKKSSCDILDLGSGSPSITGCIYAALQLPLDCEPPGMYSYGGGSYGSFRVMAHARDLGLHVSLTSVDVIFPPLSRPIQGESPAYFEGYPYSVISNWFQSTNVTCVGDNIEGFIKQSRIKSEKFDIVASRTVYSGGLALDDAHLLLKEQGIFIMDFSKIELQSDGSLMSKDQETIRRHCIAGGFCDATILLSEKPTHSCGQRLFFSSVVMFHQGASEVLATRSLPAIHVERTMPYKIPPKNAMDISHLFPGVTNFRNVLSITSDAELTSRARKLLGLYFSSAKSGVSSRILPALAKAYAAIKCMASDFEMVFISTDDTEEQMLDHYSQMPWLCPNWIDVCAIREHLYTVCDVEPYWDIPRLVLFDMTAGEILSNDAAAAMMDFEHNHFSTADAVTFGCTLSSQKQKRLEVLKIFGQFMVESVPRAAETISLEVVQAPKASSIYERLSMAALQGKSSVALLFGTAPKASLILSGAIFSGCLQVLFFPIICGIQTTGIGAAAEALPENWQLQENHAFVAAMYLAVQADINISLLVLLGNDSILNARSIDSVTGYTVFYAGPVE